MNDATNENDPNYRVRNNNTATSKYFEYKTKANGSTPAYNNRLETKVVVSLKYLSNLWICIDLPLINIEVKLNW